MTGGSLDEEHGPPPTHAPAPAYAGLYQRPGATPTEVTLEEEEGEEEETWEETETWDTVPPEPENLPHATGAGAPPHADQHPTGRRRPDATEEEPLNAPGGGPFVPGSSAPSNDAPSHVPGGSVVTAERSRNFRRNALTHLGGWFNMRSPVRDAIMYSAVDMGFVIQIPEPKTFNGVVAVAEGDVVEWELHDYTYPFDLSQEAYSEMEHGVVSSRTGEVVAPAYTTVMKAGTAFAPFKVQLNLCVSSFVFVRGSNGKLGYMDLPIKYLPRPSDGRFMLKAIGYFWLGRAAFDSTASVVGPLLISLLRLTRTGNRTHYGWVAQGLYLPLDPRKAGVYVLDFGDSLERMLDFVLAFAIPFLFAFSLDPRYTPVKIAAVITAFWWDSIEWYASVPDTFVRTTKAMAFTILATSFSWACSVWTSPYAIREGVRNSFIAGATMTALSAYPVAVPLLAKAVVGPIAGVAAVAVMMFASSCESYDDCALELTMTGRIGWCTVKDCWQISLMMTVVAIVGLAMSICAIATYGGAPQGSETKEASPLLHASGYCHYPSTGALTPFFPVVSRRTTDDVYAEDGGCVVTVGGEEVTRVWGGGEVRGPRGTVVSDSSLNEIPLGASSEDPDALPERTSYLPSLSPTFRNKQVRPQGDVISQ